MWQFFGYRFMLTCLQTQYVDGPVCTFHKQGWGLLSDQYPRNRAGVLLCTMVGMAASHLLLALGLVNSCVHACLPACLSAPGMCSSEETALMPCFVSRASLFVAWRLDEAPYPRASLHNAAPLPPSLC